MVVAATVVVRVMVAVRAASVEETVTVMGGRCSTTVRE